MPAFELARLTWADAEPAFARARVALVPIGSCEQHGPHMTLDTDTAIAVAFARRLADGLGEDAMLCPAVNYGMSEHHLGYAGTLTLRGQTLIGIVRDIAESLAHQGIERVLFVNGHGGNLDGLRLAAREVFRDKGIEVGGIMWALLAADLIAERAVGQYAHACDIETSVALALAPQVVLADRIEAPVPPKHEAVIKPVGDRVDLPVRFEDWTGNGSLGDPRLATKELGEEIVALALKRAASFARRFIEKGSA